MFLTAILNEEQCKNLLFSVSFNPILYDIIKESKYARRFGGFFSMILKLLCVLRSQSEDLSSDEDI